MTPAHQWLAIAFFVGVGLILGALVLWKRTIWAKKKDLSGGFLTERELNSRMGPPPDLRERMGPSPELLHERWEDFERAKRTPRRGPLAVDLAQEQKRRERDPLDEKGFYGPGGLMGVGALGSIANEHVHHSPPDCSPSDSGSSDSGSCDSGGGE